MKYSNRLMIFTAFALFFTIFNQACAQRKYKTYRHAKLANKEKALPINVEQKIDSRLLQAIKESRGEKNANPNLEPAQVNADKQGNLKVDISAKISDDFLNKIKALGGKIIYPSVPYNTVRAEINLSKVETIAAFAEVKFIEPAVLSTTQPIQPVINK